MFRAKDKVKLPPPNDLEDVITAAGGQWLSSTPSAQAFAKANKDHLIVISTPSLAAKKPTQALGKIGRADTAYTWDFIKFSLLRQELQFSVAEYQA